MPNSKQIVYLSQSQYTELITNGTITVDGVTVTYNENDIYATPQAEPVTDVQINGTSITVNGVANVPVGGSDTFGVVKVGTLNNRYGIGLTSDNVLRTISANNDSIKSGNGFQTCFYCPIVPSTQHISTFYGLAKASGDTTQSSSSNAIGVYTPEAKAAIQSMLGISNILAPTETSTASKAYSIGEVFTANGKLYKATAAIAASESIVTQDAGETVSGSNAAEVKVSEYAVRDVQMNGTSIMQDGVANVPLAYGKLGAVKINGYGLTIVSASTNPNYGTVNIVLAGNGLIKAGSNGYNPIVPSNQHTSIFYGLSKAAGVDLANETVTFGTYPDSSKAAIQHMLGTDTNLASYESDTTSDQAYAIGELFMLNGKLHQATAAIAIDDTLEVGTNCAVVNAAGVFTHDVQVNSTSVVSNGVANVPAATTSVLGVVSLLANGGITKNSDSAIYVQSASDAEIKSAGSAASYKPIVPYKQHQAVFYGLAKAAGDTTQSASSNAVGTYTDNAKASIKSMLGIVDGSTGTVDITGTTPTITAVENTRYVCGEVSTLSFTPAASGICIVRFTSGSTATILTLPSTVKFPEWFDATALEADTIYEICITDGVYGAVMSWAL